MAHNCHGNNKYFTGKPNSSLQKQLLQGKTKYLTAQTITSRQNQKAYGRTKSSRQTQILNGITKYLTAKTITSRQNQQAYGRTKSSRQKQLLHGKPKYFTANPNTSQQNQYPTVNSNTSRYNQKPTAKEKHLGKTKRLTKEVRCSREEQNRKKILYQRVLDTNCVRERCSFGIAIGIVFYHDVSFVLSRRGHNFPQRPSFTDW